MNLKLQKFKGFMAPTFTPFSKENEVNCEVIEPYAKFLKQKGINAVLVNGSLGEGMLLNVEERKKVAERWSEVCKKLDLLMMVLVSGCAFVDAVELAKHAEMLQVDGVLCLPDLYFKPKSIQKLVEYLKDISAYCPNTPLYYYHIPMFTQVDLPLGSLMALARDEIKTFSGIKYSSGDLEKALPCLRHGQVFLGPETILCGALALGFENAIMSSLNLHPEISLKIVNLIENGNVQEAKAQQQLLNAFIDGVLKKGNGEWVPSMKNAFNEMFGDVLFVGGTRKPL
jgi:N-acetylneuraminate lyase